MPSHPGSGYFVAQAGAAGASTGLTLLALSFNLEQVVKDEAWVGPAGTGVIMLAGPILSAPVCLFPSRNGVVPAWVLLGVSLFTLTTLAQIIPPRASRTAQGSDVGSLLTRVVFTLTEPVIAGLGALLVLVGFDWGRLPIASGALYGVAVGLYPAWVLLVGIRRLPGRF